MRLFLIALAMLAATSAQAQWISEYTEYDRETDCALIGRALDGEGDWADHVCPGYANYPFVIRYGDARESITYGFGVESGMATFGAFNYARDVVEWRVRIAADTERPVAAIQRWYLANSMGEWEHEILVVSRVGQPGGGGACAIGFVDAALNGANMRARAIADTHAEGFACGADAPVIEETIAGMVSPQ